MTKTQLYKKRYNLKYPWMKHYFGMVARCKYKSHNSYDRYGGAGISCLMTSEDVKKLWFRDKAFSMKRPSIDRIDSLGNYELDNCRFLELSDNSGRGGCKKKPWASKYNHLADPIRELHSRGFSYMKIKKITGIKCSDTIYYFLNGKKRKRKSEAMKNYD